MPGSADDVVFDPKTAGNLASAAPAPGALSLQPFLANGASSYDNLANMQRNMLRPIPFDVDFLSYGGALDQRSPVVSEASKVVPQSNLYVITSGQNLEKQNVPSDAVTKGLAVAPSNVVISINEAQRDAEQAKNVANPERNNGPSI